MATETNALRRVPATCGDNGHPSVIPPRVGPALHPRVRVAEVSADAGGPLRASHIARHGVRKSTTGTIVLVDAPVVQIAELSNPCARPPATDGRECLVAAFGRSLDRTRRDAFRGRHPAHRRSGVPVAARRGRSRRAKGALSQDATVPSRVGTLPTRNILAAAWRRGPGRRSLYVEVRSPAPPGRAEG